jgi:hypothetical protein
VPVPEEPAGLTAQLADHDPAVAALCRRLRAAALSALPDLTERHLPGWRALGLRHPRGGHLAAIFPGAGDVVVHLEHGASLPDPHGLLAGAGRRTRKLVYTPGVDRPTDAHLVEYLDLALDHALARVTDRPTRRVVA